jgi:hypothetical protein
MMSPDRRLGMNAKLLLGYLPLMTLFVAAFIGARHWVWSSMTDDVVARTLVAGVSLGLIGGVYYSLIQLQASIWGAAFFSGALSAGSTAILGIEVAQALIEIRYFSWSHDWPVFLGVASLAAIAGAALGGLSLLVTNLLSTKPDATHHVVLIAAVLLTQVACMDKDSQSAASANKKTYVYAGFPELRPEWAFRDSMPWIFQDGPDFYLYSTIDEHSPAVSVGIYFGHHPSFHRSAHTRSEPGNVASTQILWSIADETQGSESCYFRETIFIYPPHEDVPESDLPLRIHVWIHADSAEAMQRLMSALENLELIQLEKRSQYEGGI